MRLTHLGRVSVAFLFISLCVHVPVHSPSSSRGSGPHPEGRHPSLMLSLNLFLSIGHSHWRLPGSGCGYCLQPLSYSVLDLALLLSGWYLRGCREGSAHRPPSPEPHYRLERALADPQGLIPHYCVLCLTLSPFPRAMVTVTCLVQHQKRGRALTARAMLSSLVG